MGEHFFTSDLHLGHKNIIKNCQRPFDSLREMEDAIHANWNECVSEDDTVWLLGDVTLSNILYYEDYIKSLNGIKILIAGNLDRGFYAKKGAKLSDDYAKAGFAGFIPSGIHWATASMIGLERPLEDENVLLSHYPAREVVEKKWQTGHEANGLRRFNLCGHVHGAWLNKGRSLNIGVDAWDFMPVSADEVSGLLKEVIEGSS